MPVCSKEKAAIVILNKLFDCNTAFFYGKGNVLACFILNYVMISCNSIMNIIIIIITAYVIYKIFIAFS